MPFCECGKVSFQSILLIMKFSKGNSELQLSERDAIGIARRVTWLGFWVNVLLAVLKIVAGVIGRSSAMVADGIHSFSDFVSDIIVLIFVGVARRKANRVFQYGHGKFETFATMLLALALGVVGLMFFFSGAGKVWAAAHGVVLEQPGRLALAMAVVSIVAKEWLFHVTKRAGDKIRSAVVVANAWHHRSDALSSLATFVGIGGAIFFGEQWRVLDPLAAMVVSVLIIIVAVKIGKPAISELLECSLPADVVNGMYRIIGETPGVKAFHHFASRQNGNRFFVECHIKVDPDATIVVGHQIASAVENRLKEVYGKNITATIHVEPYAGQPVDENNMCG